MTCVCMLCYALSFGLLLPASLRQGFFLFWRPRSHASASRGPVLVHPLGLCMLLGLFVKSGQCPSCHFLFAVLPSDPRHFPFFAGDSFFPCHSVYLQPGFGRTNKSCLLHALCALCAWHPMVFSRFAISYFVCGLAGTAALLHDSRK